MNSGPGNPGRALPLGYAVAGALLLVAGLMAAQKTLPEWHVPTRPPKEAQREVMSALVRCGASTGELSLRLRRYPGYPVVYGRAFRLLGSSASAYLRETGGFVAWTLSGDMRIANGPVGQVDVYLDSSGRIQRLDWNAGGPFLMFRELPAEERKVREAFSAKFLEVLSRGQARGPDSTNLEPGGNAITRVWPLASEPGRPEEWLTQTIAGTNGFALGRELSDASTSEGTASRLVSRALFLVALGGVLGFCVLATLGVLLFKRRLSFRIALVLGVLAFGSAILSGAIIDSMVRLGGWVSVLYFLGGLGSAGFIVALWAVAESLIRDSVPGFTTSLDSLAAGRLGPRSGRALLCGLGIGAAIAGSRLLLAGSAGGLASHGVKPEFASFAFPFFGFIQNPFAEGSYIAGTILLLAAVFRRGLAKEKADPLAVLTVAIGGATASPLHPWGASFVMTLVVGVFLLLAFRKFGLTGFLVAAVSSYLWRDLLGSYAYLSQAVLPFLIAVISLGAVLVVGFVALGRREEIDEEKLGGPEYVRRLEAERRVKFEMDLLSRMQLALLPEKPPSVKGLDLAARSLIATEAGGDLYDFITDSEGFLWVAAGDVAGHGYSCGIQQAMVKASLVSLVKAGQTPSRVLAEIHRVLRSVGKTKLFTSLLLLKVDPKTGLVLLANAGHPYPLVVSEGRAEEIQVPGLPLGQGPPREYADVSVTLEQGATLVMASDGLFEGTNRLEVPYGYSRAQAVLTAVGLWRRPADGIVEALLSDLERHASGAELADDTTIVAVKRTSLAW